MKKFPGTLSTLSPLSPKMLPSSGGLKYHMQSLLLGSSQAPVTLDNRMPIPEGIQKKRAACLPSMTGRCWSSCGSVDWRVARCRQLAACLGATAGAGYLQEIIEYKAIDRSMRPIAPWLAEELHSTEPVHIGTALGCTLPSQSLTI